MKTNTTAFKYFPLIAGLSLHLLFANAVLAADAAPQEAVVIEAPSNEVQVQLLLQEADAYLQQNLYEEAIGKLTEAYSLAGNPEDSPIARNVMNALANLYYNTGQLEAAYRYFEQLVALDEANNDIAGLSVSLFNLGHAAASRQLFTEADAVFQRSLVLSEQLGDESGTAFTLKAMGVNAQATGAFNNASSLLLLAWDKFRALGDEQQSASVLRNLGDIALAQGDAQGAVDYYMKAMPILVENSFNAALLRTYRGLSMAYERLGKLDKALIAQRAYSDMMQFDLQQQSMENTNRMQAEFETQRYADDNTRLQALRIQQELELEESQQLVRLQYLVLVLALVVLGLVFFMFLRSRELAKRMHRLAITDELTKLLNRRAIMNKGREEWDRAERFKQPLACLMFDVDHFKSINDTFGHAIGDVVLKAIAEALRELMRKTDYVGRVGGEEFLILAPGTDDHQAITLAERIRTTIANTNITELGERRITVSIGIARVNEESTLEQLINHADKALYVAKEAGRNRCVMYRDDLEKPQSVPEPKSKAPLYSPFGQLHLSGSGA